MLVALKPIMISGVKYKIGDEIDKSTIGANAVIKLVKQNLIEEAPDKVDIVVEKEIIKVYDEETLSGLKKTELIEIAKQEGIITSKKSTKELVDELVKLSR